MSTWFWLFFVFCVTYWLGSVVGKKVVMKKLGVEQPWSREQKQDWAVVKEATMALHEQSELARLLGQREKGARLTRRAVLMLLDFEKRWDISSEEDVAEKLRSQREYWLIEAGVDLDKEESQ